MKEKNQLQLGNRLHDFSVSFVLFFLLLLLYLNIQCQQKERETEKKKNLSCQYNYQVWWSMTGIDDARRWLRV